MNLKNLKLISAAALVLFLVGACIALPPSGSRRLVTETRSVSGFEALVLTGAGQLDIIQDGSESLLIETDEDTMELITTEVRDGSLYLGFDTSISFAPREVHVTLHVRSLERIAVAGAWEITCASLETERLEVEISGAGSLQLDDLQAEALSAEISGAGQMEIAGRVVTQEVSISGAGRYQAGDLQSETASVSITGTGQATVWVSDSLTVETNGAGRVEYYGHPQVSSAQSGVGNIHSLGDK
ncbi:MAG: head GIN domain-containing protein [Anaerolineales bacterium]